MEHRSSGQIGQPAACMIENNRALSVTFRCRSVGFGTGDYGPKGWLSRICDASVATTHPRRDRRLAEPTQSIHRNCG